jgi:hypothetical protein
MIDRSIENLYRHWLSNPSMNRKGLIKKLIKQNSILLQVHISTIE